MNWQQVQTFYLGQYEAIISDMTMAAVEELDSFYFKFKHLLFAGFEANLELKSKNGKAFVTLNAELGSINVGKANKKHKSPSYFNRLQKRKEDRQNANNLNQNIVTSAEKKDAGEASESSYDTLIKVDTAAVKAVQHENGDTSDAAVEAVEPTAVAVKETVVVTEKVTAEASEADEEIEKDVAEKQDFAGKKWQCVVHGCMVEHGNDLACTCCDSCQGFVYGSDEDDDYDDIEDLEDPP